MNDITINRHKGNACSRDANERASHIAGKVRDTLYRALCQNPRGMTSGELRAYLNVWLPRADGPWQKNQFSGRLTWLKAEGFIHGTGERRNGSEVLVVTQRQQELFGRVA